MVLKQFTHGMHKPVSPRDRWSCCNSLCLPSSSSATSPEGQSKMINFSRRHNNMYPYLIQLVPFSLHTEIYLLAFLFIGIKVVQVTACSCLLCASENLWCEQYPAGLNRFVYFIQAISDVYCSLFSHIH